MARRLGRQIGDRRDNFSRQSFFLLAMATKTVAAWSAVYSNLQTEFKKVEINLPVASSNLLWSKMG